VSAPGPAPPQRLVGNAHGLGAFTMYDPGLICVCILAGICNCTCSFSYYHDYVFGIAEYRFFFQKGRSCGMLFCVCVTMTQDNYTGQFCLL
jgi:hypothetical protein